MGEVFRKLAEQNEPDCASIRRAEKKLCGQYFRARSYWLATKGRDEAAIRDYIRQQEHEDQRLDQLNLWRSPASPSRLKPWGRVSDPA